MFQRDNFLGVLLGRCQQAHGVSESGPWAVGGGGEVCVLLSFGFSAEAEGETTSQ